MSESISRIERALRRAVVTQQFAEVERLVLAFCAAVEAHVRALPSGDPSIPEIAAMVGEVLQWTRSMMYAARENLSAQLKEIPKMRAYVPAPLPRVVTMQLDV